MKEEIPSRDIGVSHLTDNKKCIRCGRARSHGVSFRNQPANEEQVSFPKTFTYMEEGEQMHMECYIEHVVETHIKKMMKEK